MKNKKDNKTFVEKHMDFIAFLEKRIQSKNFKEYNKTVEKLKKARLKLRLGLIK